MKSAYSAILIMLLLFCSSKHITAGNMLNDNEAIQDPVISKFNDYFSFKKFNINPDRDLKKDVSIGNASDLQIPYLNDNIRGDKTYVMTLYNVAFIDTYRADSAVGLKNIRIVIDSVSKKLLEIRGVDAGLTFGDVEYPSSKIAESQMKDKYYGFPEDLPGKDFYDVIMGNNILIGSIIGSRGFCVNYVIQGGAPSSLAPGPRWIITFKGLSPMKPSYGRGDDLSYDQLTTERYIINSDDGNWIMSTTRPFVPNVPHPK